MTANRSKSGDRPASYSGSRRGRQWPVVTRYSECRRTAMTCGSSREPQVPGGPPGKCGTRRLAPVGAPRHSDRRHKMVGATMDTDGLLKRVRAIPGVMEASIMHGRQRDRLYVKVASGDANHVNRRAHPLLEQYLDLGLLYEYEQTELPLIGPPCRRIAAAGRGVDRPAPEPDIRGSPPLAGAAVLNSGVSPGLIALTPKAHSVKLCCFGGSDS